MLCTFSGGLIITYHYYRRYFLNLAREIIDNGGKVRIGRVVSEIIRFYREGGEDALVNTLKRSLRHLDPEERYLLYGVILFYMEPAIDDNLLEEIRQDVNTDLNCIKGNNIKRNIVLGLVMAV